MTRTVNYCLTIIKDSKIVPCDLIFNPFIALFHKHSNNDVNCPPKKIKVILKSARIGMIFGNH